MVECCIAKLYLAEAAVFNYSGFYHQGIPNKEGRGWLVCRAFILPLVSPATFVCVVSRNQTLRNRLAGETKV